jgi:hypothetical protein
MHNVSGAIPGAEPFSTRPPPPSIAWPVEFEEFEYLGEQLSGCYRVVDVKRSYCIIFRHDTQESIDLVSFVKTFHSSVLFDQGG